jgi:serine O-acetyltransferase
MSWWGWGLVALGVWLAWALLAFRDEIRACFERDPAARGLVEVLLTYPGLHAVMAHRMTHVLFRMGVPVLPRLITAVTRCLTGIEIHPGARIGRGLFIDHGTGVVIGETAVVGRNVTMFQGATLGGTGKERGKRHPTIGDEVVIGAGAKVLGSITIGPRSMVGANAVVVRDVPANSTVVGVPGRVTRTADRHFPGINLAHSQLPDPLTERLEKLQHEIDVIERHLKEFRASKKSA